MPLPTTKKQRSTHKPKLNLTMQYATQANDLPKRAQFQQWIQAALQSNADITLRFVDEAEGRDLNKKYRNKDYATNILTFSYHAANTQCEGDLVICSPLVKKEAIEQGKAIEAHYAHLTIHGTLHLQGYDHEIETDAQIMEAIESDLLLRLGYPDPY